MFQLLLWLGLSQVAQAENKYFKCYLALAEISDKPLIFANKKASIENHGAYSFDLITAAGIRACTVPSDAPLAPGSRTSEAHNVRVSVDHTKYFLEYGKEVAVINDPLSKGTFKDAQCAGAVMNEQRWLKIFGERISEKMSECGGDNGMGVDAPCIPRLLDVMTACQASGGAKTHQYFSELLQATQSQTAYRPPGVLPGKASGEGAR